MKIIKPSRKRNLKESSEASDVMRQDASGITGSGIDIFDDDESWNTQACTRTNASGKRFTKSSINKRGSTVSGENKNEANLKATRSKLRSDNSKTRFIKQDASQYEEVEPLLNGKKRRRSELGTSEGRDSNIGSALETIIDSQNKEFNSVLSRGIRLLATREHSVSEVTKKLLGKFEEADLVYAVVDELVKLKYVSDERFAECYVRSRANKGFGPIKIKAELGGKGVCSNVIHDYLKEGSGVWFDNAKSQYNKKYGDTPVEDYKAWAKRAKFLQSRGFTTEQIHCSIPPSDVH